MSGRGGTWRSRRAPWPALLPLLLLGVACERAEAPPAAVLDSTRPYGAVVFLLDTVRADRLSSYGHFRETTPVIDSLAARGARFEQVVSYSSWTLPATIAILAGDYPARVVDDENRMQRSLVEAISAAGYRTAAFTEGSFFSDRWGMDKGFGHYRETPYATLVEKGGADIEGTFAAAAEWLRANADAPFFLVIQTYEAHMPYRRRDFVDGVDPGRIAETFEFTQQGKVVSGELVLTDAERDYIARLYDGDILATDRHVGEFLALLEELGLRDRTVVAVTSDHGEELGDQFRSYVGGHGHSLRDNLLLVPLVLDDPTREFAVREVASQVRSLDLLPTLAELLGVEVGREIAGRSLVPILDGDEVADRIAMSADNRRGAARLGIRDGRYKYIATIGPPRTEVETSGPQVARVQLYDLAADPHERKNLARAQPRLKNTLAAAVANWWNGLGGPAVEVDADDLDERMRDRLKALGYVE